LQQVGLGYIAVGQPSTTLSGGEAQRIKLANELAKTDTGKTLYLLDEPTTGLHIDDVVRLIGVMQSLVDKGNTVLVVEHHMDLVRCADWLIDMGPGGGDAGGTLIGADAPKDFAARFESPTSQALRKFGVR
jgi:excinuclease ABC subunit A